MRSPPSHMTQCRVISSPFAFIASLGVSMWLDSQRDRKPRWNGKDGQQSASLFLGDLAKEHLLLQVLADKLLRFLDLRTGWMLRDHAQNVLVGKIGGEVGGLHTPTLRRAHAERNLREHEAHDGEEGNHHNDCHRPRQTRSLAGADEMSGDHLAIGNSRAKCGETRAAENELHGLRRIELSDEKPNHAVGHRKSGDDMRLVSTEHENGGMDDISLSLLQHLADTFNRSCQHDFP